MKRIFLLLLACLVLPLAGAQARQKGGAFSGSRYFLELDGTPIGQIQKFEGGGPVGNVVARSNGTLQDKQLKGFQYEPIAFDFSAAQAPALFQWLASTLKGDKLRRSGAIIIADFNYNVVRRLEFKGAILTELTLPALDATSKEATRFHAVLTPERTQLVPVKGTAPKEAISKTRLMPSNFRITLPGLDTKRVIQVSALTIRQSSANGERPSYEISDVEFLLPSADTESYEKWLQTNVVEGKGQEIDGKIELLDPALTTTLATITLSRLGLYQLSTLPTDSGADTISRTTAKFYVEGFDIQFNVK